MKVTPQSEEFAEFFKNNNIFELEQKMFETIIPQFEQMYEKAGLSIKFGARSYKLNTEEGNLLLEDLKPYGFKNADRLKCLDMVHTKAVLKKLAQYHAASANRTITEGPYEEKFLVGSYKEDMKAVIENVFVTATGPVKDCLKMYEGHEEYGKDLVSIFVFLHMIEQFLLF